jgi:hypothetical protein
MFVTKDDFLTGDVSAHATSLLKHTVLVYLSFSLLHSQSEFKTDDQLKEMCLSLLDSTTEY